MNATARARLTTVFQVSGRACAASIAAAFAATGADFPALTGPGSAPSLGWVAREVETR